MTSATTTTIYWVELSNQKLGKLTNSGWPKRSAWAKAKNERIFTRRLKNFN